MRVPFAARRRAQTDAGERSADDASPRTRAPASASDFESRALPHLDAAYRLARYLLGDDADAADAVQEAYLRALRAFDQLRADDARAWLLTIVRHTCYTALAARRSRDTEESFDEDVHSSTDAGDSPDDELIRRATRESLERAVAALPAEYREAFVLREVDGMSYKEIATITRVPIGTVMSRLARARTRLRSALTREGEEHVR
ncbi:MAG TPA: sigma-70 family RNA polymerase sigma factor [Gemmatimonadaceae bacterium]|nr:sigma-70 family RNA polymerase sigma factor [Gemmatimonadaceae bacterium]